MIALQKKFFDYRKMNDMTKENTKGGLNSMDRRLSPLSLGREQGLTTHHFAARLLAAFPRGRYLLG